MIFEVTNAKMPSIPPKCSSALLDQNSFGIVGGGRCCLRLGTFGELGIEAFHYGPCEKSSVTKQVVRSMIIKFGLVDANCVLGV